MKSPHKFSRDYIERPKIAGRGTVLLTGGRAHDEQVLKDSSRCSGFDLTDALDIASQPFPQIDIALIAERRDELAGARVHRVKNIVGGKEEAAIGAILTLPIRKAAFTDHVRLAGLVNP